MWTQICREDFYVNIDTMLVYILEKEWITVWTIFLAVSVNSGTSTENMERNGRETAGRKILEDAGVDPEEIEWPLEW